MARGESILISMEAPQEPEGPESFQLGADAAELYEAKFVPAIFSDWTPHLIDLAGINPSDNVLDAACGTGVVARHVAERLEGGKVTGVDLNEAMLAVARRLRPDIEYRHADVQALPFADRSFDVVLCQAALMFFPDRPKAMQEMARVTAPGGTVAVQVWGALESQPAYGPLVEAAARHIGPQARTVLGSYWVLGDADKVRWLFQQAGLEVGEVRTRLGTSVFESIDDLVRSEIEATPLLDRITDEMYQAILKECREALKPFESAEGKAEIPIQGHLVSGRRPRRDSTTLAT